MKTKRYARLLAHVVGIIIFLGIAFQASTPDSVVKNHPLDKTVVTKLGITKILLVQRNELNPTHVYTYHQEGLMPGGGLWIWDTEGKEPRLTKILDSSEGEIIDANVSYDGSTILFSWKRTMNDFFQLYTIGIDGENLRQITSHNSNNFNACWLPDGGIAFLSDRKPAYAYCWQTTTPILWRCESDGSKPIRLSANYLNDFTPSVLQDGRILYSRWEYVDRPAIPIQSLWTINPDGTNLGGVFGNRSLSPATFMDAREIPDMQRKILCVLTSHNGPCRGAIGIIDTRFGSNSQKGITNITPEIEIGLVDKGDGNRIRGPYLNPFPIDNQYYLVSKAGTIELRDYAMTENYLIAEAQDLGFYNPQPIRPRQKEASIPSFLADQTQDDDQQQWATIYMQDVYIGLEDFVKRGEIKKIAVVQEVEKPVGISPDLRAFGFQFPVVSAGATYAPKKIWGYASVEEDGSAHFKVPAREPIYFLPLNEEGMAVQRMRTFTHLMPGETQGCVGCHSDRNQVAPTLLRSRPKAMLRQAEELEIPAWGVTGFSYANIVQPIWDKHCISCHGPDKPAGGLELSGDKTDFFNISYENLVRKNTSCENFLRSGVGEVFKQSKYTSWIPTYNGQEENILLIEPGQWGAKASLLASIIQNAHKDDQGDARISLSNQEKLSVYTWLDLNVPYYSNSSSNYLSNRGCRQMVPDEFHEIFKDMASRRCVSCHTQQDSTNVFTYPNSFALRIDNPELNPFLRSPLATDQGGTGKCKETVFLNQHDPDYQAILQTFKNLQKLLESTPRLDMNCTID
jgi:hypothetical protein